MPGRVRRLPSLLGLAAGLLLGACGGAAATATPPPPGTAAGTATGAPPPRAAAPEPGEFLRPRVSIPVAGHPPVPGHPWYLAVGDSITSGFTVDPARSGVNSAWAVQLQGMLAARGEAWQLYDTACPGETTQTYSAHCSGAPAIPFLAAQSQRDAALAAIRSDARDLRLILVDLGSNDLLHAFERGGISPTAVAARLRSNLAAAVAELERAAPGVPVVIGNYYNPLENALPATEAQLALVNLLIAAVAKDAHARLADFHAAVNGTAAPNPALGEYVDLAHGDVHPTVAGHTLLARTALAVIP